MSTRSKPFVPQLLLALQKSSSFTCKFTSLPTSYQSQPYNLEAKIMQRGGIRVKVIFNKANDTFVVMKLQPTKQPANQTTNGH